MIPVFKRWLRRIHLSLAILMVFFLVNLSISGALLVFGKEIQNQVQPTHWLVSPNITRLPLSELVTLIEANSASRIKHIQLAPQKDKAWQFQLDNGQNISVDLFNGNILHDYAKKDNFYGFVMAWHRWLLWRDESEERPLMLVLKIWLLEFGTLNIAFIRAVFSV
ncbi:MAG: PepSY-associated TM helix domain-containing protein [Oceanospirillaceae bacterium]